MNLKQCLEDLIRIYNNDICFGKDDLLKRYKAKILLGEVIILLTEMQLDAKHCGAENFPSPISMELMRLIKLEGKELKNLIPYDVNYDFILSLC
jgi:hypothetical protein